jgi:putative ABC transport system ATP-binding protein
VDRQASKPVRSHGGGAGPRTQPRICSVTALLEARGLQKRYRGTTLLADLNLTLRAGDVAVLLGPSGSGKTTLLGILGCLLAPDEGELRIAGERVDFTNVVLCASVRHAHIGFIAQRAPVPPFVTIEQNLIAMAESSGLAPGAGVDRARELLFRVGLAAHLEKFPTELDRGQLQRLGVAHALLRRPQVLLADDPTSGLERPQADTIVNLLIAQARVSGAALVMITHDPHVLSRFDRILTLDAGRLHDHSAFGRRLSATNGRREPMTSSNFFVTSSGR